MVTDCCDEGRVVRVCVIVEGGNGEGVELGAGFEEGVEDLGAAGCGEGGEQADGGERCCVHDILILGTEGGEWWVYWSLEVIRR